MKIEIHSGMLRYLVNRRLQHHLRNADDALNRARSFLMFQDELNV